MGRRLERFLHGPHLAVWEAFARAHDGRWHSATDEAFARAEFPHPHGPIVLDGDVTLVMTGKVMIPVLSTRFSVARPSQRAHRFSVSRASFASNVAEWFGALDIHVDDPTFDAAFVLRGVTPDVVRRLFADAALRERFLTDFEGTLALRDDTTLLEDPTPGIDPLELSIPGMVDDAARLDRLYALFAATLDRLTAVTT